VDPDVSLRACGHAAAAAGATADPPVAAVRFDFLDRAGN